MDTLDLSRGSSLLSSLLLGLLIALASACGLDEGPASDASPSGDTRADASPPGDSGPGEVVAPRTFEEPIRVVFKVHIEPQSDVTRYRTRRDDVEAVRAIAERHGAVLTLHGNGGFWQYALEEGDQAMVRAWIDHGHDVGPHMHAVHENPDGSHAWRNATPPEQEDEAFVRGLWDDHLRHLQAVLPPGFVVDQATPYNSLDETYVDMMADYGFAISGGGRHEIAEGWFGHPPFFPWRLGASYLEEDLASPVLIVHHQAQLGEAKDHGPPGGRVFQDHTVAHMQVSFLQVYLNRMLAERRNEPHDRIWMWGFLTHDNQSDPARRAEIEALLGWLDEHFGRGRASLRGHTILEYADFSDVRDAYLDWEAAHPGVSSNHVPTPMPIEAADMTRITADESRRIYPYELWGMAQLLRADRESVVDFVRFDTSVAGVEIAELSVGSRTDPGARAPRWVVWNEEDLPRSVDLRALVGGEALRAYDAVSGVATVIPAGAVTVGELPLIIERAP